MKILSNAPEAPASVASPCVNVCKMNPATQLCEGCLRTIDEIAAWSSMTDDEKRAVLARLPQRKRA
jgi:predicted Fe-S protein YdhL (DUF1289 family)